MFVDEVRVYARAGHGGPGCVAFHREAYIPKGGPSGGNGGRGGDVIFEADHDLNNLIHQYFQPRLIAKDGEPGQGKGMDGSAGDDLLVKVPRGTLVWKLLPLPGEETHDEEGDTDSKPPKSSLTSTTSTRPVIRSSGDRRAIELDLAAGAGAPAPTQRTGANAARPRELVCDLTADRQRYVLCKGGRGGLGNRNFATSVRQAPRFAQPGESGGEGEYLLELRLMADVGLVGYPNAGKSTILAAISAARPKIAPYPFTTLAPQAGIVEFPDWARITVCDVPGLVPGAHRNIGLGHAFLRHISRCAALAVVVDMAGSEERAPWDDYRGLLKELELYDASLLAKPRVIVANKMDEPHADANLRSFRRRIRGQSILPVAAAFDVGTEDLKLRFRELAAERAAT